MVYIALQEKCVSECQKRVEQVSNMHNSLSRACNEALFSDVALTVIHVPVQELVRRGRGKLGKQENTVKKQRTRSAEPREN